MIVGYKIKEEKIKELIELYENFKDLCSIYEFFTYVGIPPLQYKDYFLKHNMSFDENQEFTISLDKGNKVFERQITEALKINAK